MSIPVHLDIVEGYCQFCLHGAPSLVEVVEPVTRAFAYCRDQKIPTLLIDVTGLTQFTPPTKVDRFLMVEAWAREAKGIVVLAMVARPEQMNPGIFGVKVARDSGVASDGAPNRYRTNHGVAPPLAPHGRCPRVVGRVSRR
jgi:hypothetical protein